MPESEDAQRFDRLLEAMVKKPPLEIDKAAANEDEAEDLRDEEQA